MDAAAQFDGAQLNFAKNGNGLESTIKKFISHQNTQPQLIIADGLPQNIYDDYNILDDIVNQKFTLNQTAKIGTSLDNQVYTIAYKTYNPR